MDENKNTSAADRSKSSPNIFIDDEHDTSQPGIQGATASDHECIVVLETGTSESTKIKLEKAANARAEFERRREKRKLLRKRRRESKKKKTQNDSCTATTRRHKMIFLKVLSTSFSFSPVLSIKYYTLMLWETTKLHTYKSLHSFHPNRLQHNRLHVWTSKKFSSK